MSEQQPPQPVFEQILDQLCIMNRKMDLMTNSLQNLDGRVQSVEDKMSAIVVKQAVSDKKIKSISKSSMKINDELEALRRENNRLSQDALRNEFIIFGLPMFEKSKSAPIIQALSTAAGVNISLNDLVNFHPVAMRSDKQQCIVRGEFTNARIKDDFLKGWRSNKPITVEDIVELADNDTRRGKPVFISHQLSAINRKIKTEARLQKAKGKITEVWEDRGRVLVRTEDNSPAIHVLSINHLMETITPYHRNSSNSDDSEMDES